MPTDDEVIEFTPLVCRVCGVDAPKWLTGPYAGLCRTCGRLTWQAWVPETENYIAPEYPIS